MMLFLNALKAVEVDEMKEFKGVFCVNKRDGISFGTWERLNEEVMKSIGGNG